MFYYSQTDYDIEMAGRKARERAREDFYSGKSYENPYSPSDVIHYTYEMEWQHLSKMVEVDMEFEKND